MSQDELVLDDCASLRDSVARKLFAERAADEAREMAGEAFKLLEHIRPAPVHGDYVVEAAAWYELVADTSKLIAENSSDIAKSCTKIARRFTVNAALEYLMGQEPGGEKADEEVKEAVDIIDLNSEEVAWLLERGRKFLAKLRDLVREKVGEAQIGA